jgi:hypothetical protein
LVQKFRDRAGQFNALGNPPDAPDQLIPDPQICSEFNITPMTIWRWDHDPTLIELGWPPAVKIRNRKFRSRNLVESFKARLLRHALEQRGRTV